MNIRTVTVALLPFGLVGAIACSSVSAKQACSDLATAVCAKVEQCAPVGVTEVFCLAHQADHQLMLAAQALAAPYQVIPGKQIGIELPGQVAQGRSGAATQHLIQIGQTLVAGIGGDHLGVVAAETAVQDQIALFRLQPFQALARQQAQQGIAQAAAGKLLRVVFQLIEQHRHEIDHRTYAGMLLQVVGHVGVILDGVQVNPWQQEFAAAIRAVIRLVHMPEENHIDCLGHPSDSLLPVQAVSARGVSPAPACPG